MADKDLTYYQKNDGFKDFVTHLQDGGYITDGFEYVIKCVADTIRSGSNYDTLNLFSLLTKYTFIYNFYYQRWTWFCPKDKNKSEILVCLYQNIIFLKTYYGIVDCERIFNCYIRGNVKRTLRLWWKESHTSKL